MKLPKKHKLLKSKDFQELYKSRNKQTFKRGPLIIAYSVNNHDFHRLGLSLSRKSGNAVFRNRHKRIFREWFRLNYNQLTQNNNYIDLNLSLLGSSKVKGKEEKKEREKNVLKSLNFFIQKRELNDNKSS